MYFCDTAPSVPTKLKAKALSHHQIKIMWRLVADDGGAVVNYFLLKVINKNTEVKECSDVQLQGDQMTTTQNSLNNNPA